MDGWVEDLKKLKRLIIEGKYGDIETEAYVFEEAEIKNDRDYVELLEKDIPEELDRMLREAGLQCRTYYLKDDVSLPNYLAVCSVEGRKALVGLDVDFDWEAAMTTEKGESVVPVRLVGVSVLNPNARKENIDNILVYYTRK